MQTRVLGVIVLLLAAPRAHPCAAQWRIGVELATTHYGGSARVTANDSGPASFHPGGGTTVGIRLDKTLGQFGIAVRASYGKPGLAAAGEDLTITLKTGDELLEAASLVTVQVGGIGSSGAVRAELGPALHLWKFGDEIRARVGALGAAAYEWPVAGRFSGAIRLEGALSKSWFDAADVPPEYERRATWRYGVTLGLRYRL